MITAALVVGQGGRVAAYEDALLDRRSVREFAERPLDAEALRDLAHLVAEECARAAGTLLPVAAVRLGSPELGNGWYSADPELVPLPGAGPADGAQLVECLLQQSLARAAAMLVVLGDLGHALADGGPAAYSALYLRAGAALGRAWVAASAYGIGACMTAGVLEPGFRALPDADAYRRAPLAALCLGYPSERAWMP